MQIGMVIRCNGIVFVNTENIKLLNNKANLS